MSVCISVWFTQMIKTTLKTPMLLWPLVWTLFALLMNLVIGKGIIDSCLFILQMKHQHPTHPVHTELKALSWFKHHLLLAGFLEIRIFLEHWILLVWFLRSCTVSLQILVKLHTTHVMWLLASTSLCMLL